MTSSSIQQNPSISSQHSISYNATGSDTLNVTKSTLPKVQPLVENAVQSSANANLQVTEPTLKVGKPLPDVTPNVLQKNSDLIGTNIQQSTTENSKHPHLGEAFTDPISQMFTEKPSNKIVGQAMFDALKEKGFINVNGELNCEALGVAKNAKAAHIKGKVFVTENGFDFNIRGRCGDDAVKVMSAFKEVLEGIKQENPELMKDLNLSIEPNAVATPSAADLQVLGRGGQIQYKPLPNGQVVKMVLDPGENGEDDGLSVSVYDKGMKNENVKTVKVPLKVVFEGGEYGDDKTRALKDDNQALLPNWRNQRLFENSSIQKEYTAFIPGIHSLSRKDKDNTGDVKRIQAQNQLWNAVYEYLKIKVDSEDNEFVVNNRQINESTGKKDQAIQQPNVNEKAAETGSKQSTSDVKPGDATKVPASEKETVEIKDIKLTSNKKIPGVAVKVIKKTNRRAQQELLEAAKKLKDAFASMMDSCSADEKKRLDPIASELNGIIGKISSDSYTMNDIKRLDSIVSEFGNAIEMEDSESLENKVPAPEKVTVEKKGSGVVVGNSRKTKNSNNNLKGMLDAAKNFSDALESMINSCSEDEKKRLNPIASELKEVLQKSFDTMDEVEHLNSILTRLEEEILPKNELIFDTIDETEQLESSEDKVIVPEKATAETENVRLDHGRIAVQRNVRRTKNSSDLERKLLNEMKKFGDILKTMVKGMDPLDHPIVNKESLKERLREIGTTFNSVNDETKSRLIDDEIAKDIERFRQIINKYADNYTGVRSFIIVLNELRTKFGPDFIDITNKRITENELNFMRQVTESFTHFEAMRDKA